MFDKKMHAQPDVHALYQSRHRIVRAVSQACLVMALGHVVAPHVYAAEPTAVDTSRKQYTISAGPLDKALATFAAETGVTVSFVPELIAGNRTSGLNGNYAAQEGLHQLLNGSGLEAVSQGNRVFVLRKATPSSSADSVLPAVSVTATAGSATEGTGSYTSKSMNTATGLSLSQRQTPQSVSVISRQQMEDFHLTTLQEIAQAMPGIYTKGQAVSDQETNYYARGFALNQVNVDGLPLDVTGFNERNVSADMVMYDRVEVVRGATGLMQGAGAPAGSINLIRKRPTAAPLFNASASIGSWQNKQLTIDASRALNEAETLRGRVAASWRDSDSFVDVVNNKNASLYAIVEADLTPDTTLGVGFSVQRSRTDGVFVGLPTFADGRHMNLPRSTFLSSADSFQDRDNDVLFADLEHRLAGGWRTKFSITHVDAASDTRNTTNSRIAGQPFLIRQSETGWRYDTRQVVADVRASGPVDWFNRQHEVLVGASYRDDDSNAAQTWRGTSTRDFDIRNWNPYAYPMSGVPSAPNNWARKTKEKGIYAAANLNLADPLHLVLGGRFGWYAQDVTGWYSTAPIWRRSLEETAKFTPYAGLVYDLDKQHSLYVSGTQIFEPQSSMDVNGNTLPPRAGTNYEIGLKGEYFDGKLNASAAVFRIKQNNRAMRDEENCPTGGAISCSRAAGEVESEGIDLQLSGSPLPGWQIAGGYTYVIARYTRDSNINNIGKRINTDEPRRLFKLFTNYQMNGALSDWNIGGSVYAQDKTSRSETNFETSQGGYAIFGLTAGYRINKNLHLRLNVDNLFDRTYYQSLGYSWSGGLARYGTPRSALLTLNYKM